MPEATTGAGVDAGVDVDSWPFRVDIRYEDDGPAIICGGWVERTIVTLRVVSQPCDCDFHVSSITELREELAQHIKATRHIENPFMKFQLATEEPSR
jgi:hypothetical protein